MKNNSFSVSAKKRVAVNIKRTMLAFKITVVALALCMVALTVCLVLDLLSLRIEYTLEAGDELPSAAVISGYPDAKYDFGNGDGDFSVPGEYTIYIVRKSKRITVKLTVEDTSAPRGDLISLNVSKDGPLPAAKDFFTEIRDASDVTARFINNFQLSELGQHEIQIELSDPYGNSKKYKTFANVIVDTEAPVISAPQAIVGYLGEAVAYRKDVKVTDNCFGEVTLDVDSSKVDTSKVGSYTVKYTATDKAGNSSSVEVTLNIHKEKVSRDKLMDKIGILADELGITSSMSKEEKVKKIFAYVNDPKASAADANVVFTNKSNTDRSDWVLEAYKTIENGSGDCYSYFALSKAFFEYFDIENKDIQRSAGVTTQEGTHYWSMVNIGTDKDSEWYYYDATRLAKKHKTGSGCLFTEAQLENYNSNVNVGFLTFDHTGYPKTSDKTINTEYSW